MSRPDVEDILPLSPLQQGMLFHALLSPGAGAYVEQFTLRLVGRLDAECYVAAWREATARHGALRTGFVWERVPRPLQVVFRRAELAVTSEDWRRVPPGEREARLDAFREADRLRGFDLQAPPLLRLALFREDEARWTMVLTFHHLILDGWSLPIIATETLAAHEAAVRGTALELPRSRPFRDYVAWLGRQEMGRAEAFWRRALAGFTAPTPLGGGRGAAPGTATESFGFAARTVPAERMAALTAAAREHRLTVGTVLQGAWALVLARQAEVDDVVFGTVVSGRPAELDGVERMVGLFINTLPARVRVDEAAPLASWLLRLQQEQAEARAFEHTPLVEVQGWSEVPRDRPLFESLLVWENAPITVDGMDLPPDHARVVDVHHHARTSLPLVLVAAPDAGRLALKLSYDDTRFDAAFADRVMTQVEAVLDAFAADPHRRVGAVDVLPAAERARVLGAWSRHPRPYPRDATIPALFAETARARPHATAVVAPDGATLTYAELEGRANRLARLLRARGVRPGARVGVPTERSAETVVALLAVLKAGAAYVPFDPDYPAERLEGMREDAAVAAMVVLRDLPASLSWFAGPVVSFRDDAAALAAEQADEMQEVPLWADSPAYVLFTSGSTGRPKGVEVPHRGVVRLVRGADFIDFGPDEAWLQFVAIPFDVSAFEIWGALLNGARLVVHPPETPSLEELGRFVRERGVTTMWLTAGLFHQMVDARLDDLRGVRQLVAGGDAVSPAHARRVAETLPGTRMVNGYGPTENSVLSTAHTFRPGDGDLATFPIGTPLANSTAYVLDAAMRPVAPGVAGELYTGGDGVATGYVRRPGMTAERFVPDPFGGEPGARLYRTGDRVRWREDGTLEFLGRLDGQVKVRGFRIETAEVEAALVAHARVEQACVIAREDGTGERVLVAYVVPAAPSGDASSASAPKSNDAPSTEDASSSADAISSGDASASVDGPSAEELRAHLAARLPDFMVPSAFVALAALPLTSAGKVDRRALPAPDAPRSTAGYVAPRDETEETLAAIWAAVLGVARVGVHDHFFLLGGHSLRATQVISRAREALGREVPMRAIFEHPTVAALAAHLRPSSADGASATVDDAPPVVPVPRDGPLALSFAQERLWFLDRMEPGGSTYNVPAGMRLRGPLDVAAMERAVAEIVRRHEALRTVIELRDGTPVQTVRPAGQAGLPVTDLSHLSADEREAEALRLVHGEAARPFDLATGPLFRARLLRLGGDDHVLLLCMHHVVVDEWSVGVLTRELSALYAAFCEGRPSPLAPLAVQYADFAAWQRAWLTGETLERQLAYWRERFAGAPPLLELPLDRPRPAVQSFRGATLEFPLPAGTAEALEALALREGATPFMVTLAAFTALLARWSGEADVVVGTPVAGRNRRETEELIGFFVNTLALRTDTGGDPTFRQLVGRVRDAALEAQAHQDLPFERLVEALGLPRSLSHTPLFQVMFAMHGDGAPLPALAGLAAEPLPWEVEGAKFDLSLTVVRTADGALAGLEYATDLFDEGTIRRFAAHFGALAAAAAAEPDRPLSHLPLGGDDERRLALAAGNGTTRAWPFVPVHRVIAEHAAESPDAVAVEHDGRTLTRGELDALSSRIARRLRGMGVGPESRVGVCLERRPELVAALLGVLKAGAAYVPLDPTYPAARLAWMAEDAGLAALVTTDALAAIVDVGAAIPRLRIDADRAAIDAEESTDTAVPLHPESAAYVIYTSGSTGTPKGVVVPHGALANYVRTAGETYALGEADRVLQFASIGFDISVEEVFGALTAGAALVLRTDAALASPAEFARLCAAWGVTVVSLPTAFWHGVAAEVDGLHLPPSLRLVVIGGERALPERVAAWGRATGGRVALVNSYGPTECTVASTAFEIPAGAGEDGREIPIGGALANQRAYVLDAAGEPCPPGVPGELYLGGAGVARGYLRHPAMTAERFVPDAFSTEPGARLFRTGDRVRGRDDGTLEFLRRRDDQVKVRGFRVEPGEVEAALRAHPAVRDAAVVAREDAAGERRLVGYAVAAPGAETDGAALRAHLRARLPDYMVPAAVVLLDALPLTPGGKTDRRALPAPPEEGAVRTAAAAPPRGPMEEAVAATWREVLGVDAVGAEDNFFDLGGHSVGLARVQARLHERLAREVSMVDLFRFPTVRSLAAHLATGDAGAVAERGREQARSRRASLLRRRERQPGTGS